MSEEQRALTEFREACWRERLANVEDCKQKFLDWLCDDWHDSDEDGPDCPSGPVQVISHEYLAITSDEGLKAIVEERLRQIDVHGYDEKHDDEHGEGELLEAARCYLCPHEMLFRRHQDGAPTDWPFEAAAYDHAATQIERLTKAAALIAAEISRLKRAGESQH